MSPPPGKKIEAQRILTMRILAPPPTPHTRETVANVSELLSPRPWPGSQPERLENGKLRRLVTTSSGALVGIRPVRVLVTSCRPDTACGLGCPVGRFVVGVLLRDRGNVGPVGICKIGIPVARPTRQQ